MCGAQWRALRTPALTLNVSPNDNGTTQLARGVRRSGNAIDEKKIVFAELIVPKTSAYVGEVIPAEIRLGINNRVPHRLIEGATLSGQGFTSQRMPNPEQTLESINGRSYEIITFKTAITPVQSGKLEIAAKDAKAIVQVPAAWREPAAFAFRYFRNGRSVFRSILQRSFCWPWRTARSEVLQRNDND